MTIIADSEHSTLPILGATYPLHVLDTFALHYSRNIGESARFCTQMDAARLFIGRVASIGAFSIHLLRTTRTEASTQFLLSLLRLFGALEGKLRQLCIDAPSAVMQPAELRSSGLGLTVQPLRSLSEVRISGDLMLHPCCVDWTIQTLNSSPITQLHISVWNWSMTNWRCMTAFFRRLALPKLLVLDVEGVVGLLPRDLAKFLTRHTTLRSLRWPTLSETFRSRPALPAHVLPNLTALDVGPDVAWAVLGRGAAPRMQSPALVKVGTAILGAKPGVLAVMQRALACLVGCVGPVDLHIGCFRLFHPLLEIDTRGARRAANPMCHGTHNLWQPDVCGMMTRCVTFGV